MYVFIRRSCCGLSKSVLKARNGKLMNNSPGQLRYIDVRVSVISRELN